MTFSLNKSWLDDATCGKLNLDNKTFFPDNIASFTSDLLKMCYECPVRMDCLNSILEKENDLEKGMSRFGIFGGLVPNDRDEIEKYKPELRNEISNKLILARIKKRKLIEYKKIHSKHKKKNGKCIRGCLPYSE